jgi:pyruvate dehydrogenase E2 component (dihydrolipoamide acetyltransferase)
MAQIIGLPKLSPTMEEGVLVKWVKKEGDKVTPGDLVAEVETDKANMDFNIEDDGVLLKLLVKEGDTVKLGAPVAILGKAGEDVAELVKRAASMSADAGGGGGGNGASAAPAAPAAKDEAPKAERAPAEAPAAAKETPAQKAPAGASSGGPPPPAKADAAPKAAAAPKTDAAAAPAGGKLLASPLAKSLAIELGIDLRMISGSGPGGRIVERDVRVAAESGGAAPEAGGRPPEARGPRPEASAEPAQSSSDTAMVKAPPPAPTTPVVYGDQPGDWVDVPASNMRKRIAARLTEAKRDVPHFYLMRKIDVEPLMAFRGRLNALLGDRGKVSINDLIVKAVALALRRVPDCNASWQGDSIRKFRRVHVGVAVAIEDGLVTPVVRDADLKGIGVIAAEIQDLAKRAKDRHLKAHEITGSTFTVSNLGMFQIERFTAVINPPEGGILAIGGVIEEPVVKDGQIVVGKRMTVTMSCDHRVIDGALGAKFLAILVEQLEHPESLAL